VERVGVHASTGCVLAPRLVYVEPQPPAASARFDDDGRFGGLLVWFASERYLASGGVRAPELEDLSAAFKVE